MANERRTAGAPSDLSVKYFIAGVSIGESWRKKCQKYFDQRKIVFFPLKDLPFVLTGLTPI